ncbi:UNVERIFIED_CONTAM: hypothetical protein PYX00_011683 [Menopon gallinae]|uniref:Uncharacterized protein n=1 Tax=Menopon gallinae TaxID=328185 RepID=A0AAW2H8A8_9NEOP
MAEAIEAAQKYKRGEIRDLQQYRKMLACNEMMALAWHRAGAEMPGHSLFPFLVEEFVDVDKHTAAGDGRGVLKEMLCMFGTPYEHFVLDEDVICIDHAYKERLDKIRAYVGKNPQKYGRHAFQGGADYFTVSGASLVLARGERLARMREAIAAGAAEVLSELFVILAAMKFVSIESFDNSLSFVEFIIESLKGRYTREHTIEVLVKIASDFYSPDSFNLSGSFTTFLLFGTECEYVPGTSLRPASAGSLPAGDSGMHRKLLLEHRSNSLLAAALLLSTPLKLRYKLRISRIVSSGRAFDVGSRRAVQERKTYPCRQRDIVVMGMFDEHDRVYLTPYKDASLRHVGPHAFVPDLLNFGVSSMLIYKDYLRRFIAGHMQCRASGVYARIVPGIFYLHDVPLQYRNNNISIKDLRSLTCFGGAAPLKACFQENTISVDEYSESLLTRLGLCIKRMQRHYLLHLHKDKVRYKVYANHDGVVEKVATDRETLGCFHFIRPNTSTRRDLCIEIARERPLALSSLPSELSFLLEGSVLSRCGERYALSLRCSEFDATRLEECTYWVAANDRNGEARLGLVRKFSGAECTEYDAHSLTESLCPQQSLNAAPEHSDVEEFFERVWESLCLLDGVLSAETWKAVGPAATMQTPLRAVVQGAQPLRDTHHMVVYYSKNKDSMGELVLVLSVENDIIYRFEREIEGDEEYCKKYLLAYSSLDILDDVLLTTNKDFLHSINKQVATVSVVLMRSGLRVMLVTENRSREEIYLIGKSTAEVVKEFVLGEWSDYDNMIVSDKLDKCLEKLMSQRPQSFYDL